MDNFFFEHVDESPKTPGISASQESKAGYSGRVLRSARKNCNYDDEYDEDHKYCQSPNCIIRNNFMDVVGLGSTPSFHSETSKRDEQQNMETDEQLGEESNRLASFGNVLYHSGTAPMLAHHLGLRRRQRAEQSVEMMNTEHDNRGDRRLLDVPINEELLESNDRIPEARTEGGGQSVEMMNQEQENIESDEALAAPNVPYQAQSATERTPSGGRSTRNSLKTPLLEFYNSRITDAFQHVRIALFN